MHFIRARIDHYAVVFSPIFVKNNRLTSQEHLARIRKVLDYIDQHLDDELPLEKLAEMGYYSPFHFHRIFRAVTRETLLGYITRKRMEKAAMMLSLKKEKSLEEIFLEIGYNSHSTFGKTFKKHFGISPAAFRKNSPENFKKIQTIISNIGQKEVVFEQYLYQLEQMKFFMENKANIQIKEMPEMQIASVLSIGVQNIGNAYNTLISWAISKNIFPRENVKMITVYHDSFKVTSPNKVRIHAGMLLEEAIKNEGEVFLEILPKGKYIVSRQEITLPEFETAWNALFLWMNENGHQFRKECPYEIYHNDYQEHPEKKCLVDFCIPIL